MAHRFGNTLQFSGEYRAFIDLRDDGLIVITSLDYLSNSYLFYFSPDDAAQVIAAIDKYLMWDEIAVRDRDSFDKKITVIDNFQKPEIWFISSNELNHYLTIGMRSWAVPGQMKGIPDLNLDRVNAIKLKELMLKLQSGEISPKMQIENIDSKYQ